MIDVQNDFCSTEGFKAKAGHDVGAMAPMVTTLMDFIAAARQSGVKVVFIRTSHDESTSSSVWLARKRRDTSPEPLGSSPCRPGTWGAEMYEVRPEPDEDILTKHRYSAFRGTGLDQLLKSANIESLLFTGVTTEACVESSMREAFFHEYHVALVADCCASDFPKSHDATLAAIERYFGPVLQSAEIIDEWSGRPAQKEAPRE